VKWQRTIISWICVVVSTLASLGARAQQPIIIVEETGWPIKLDHNWTIHSADGFYGLQQYSLRAPHEFFDVETHVLFGGRSFTVRIHAYMAVFALVAVCAGLAWLFRIAAAGIHRRIDEKDRVA